MSKYSSVLVVHRQESLACEIKEQFDQAGWAVHVAHTGFDGLLTARKESFNLVICAVDLPVITGIEMIRGIRNYSLNLKTPVLFINDTGNDYTEIFRKLGAQTLSRTNLAQMNLDFVINPQLDGLNLSSSRPHNLV